jgi:peptidase E
MSPELISNTRDLQSLQCCRFHVLPHVTLEMQKAQQTAAQNMHQLNS